MIRELFRPLLRWLFWNRRRPLLILAALLIGTVILGRLAGCDAGSAGHAPAPATPASAPAAATGSSPSPVVPATQPPAAAPATQPAPATPASAVAAPATALQAARAFLQAWVSRAADRDAAIRATATPQLAAQATGPAAAMAPATALDGPLTVTGQAAGTVSVSVPTNAGPALLTVRLDGSRWLAAQVMLAGMGD
jgi:hypothetical protein